MKNSSMTMFITIITMSVMMILNSNNWINIWIGLEINMMAFIPMIYKVKNHLTSESCMMYFLIQSMGSMILLCMILITNTLMMTEMMINTIMSNILIMSMAIKMGVPPFHFWMPEVMNKMNWIKCLMLMTLQKIPLLFTMSLINPTIIMMVLIITSVIMGAMGGLNHTSLRKMMAYSSMNHMGWMMSCIIINKNLWILYMMMYIIITIPLMMWLNYYKLYYINQISMTASTLVSKMTLLINMMSMGGMPPFTGFYMKWMVIKSFTIMNMQFMIVIMIMCSLLTLFYYIRMMSPMFLMHYSMNNWMIKYYSYKFMLTIMFIVNMIMPAAMYIIM
uniref:NADH-ubiquinone oxidoreductase chain 2 n=1 Tax=Gorpis annulatus TaxID=696245 RepID=K7NBH0_9HEMI|nr:NADH dehydrogenase subunit 2 [Gorpis annulatus]AEI53342.1 NADH dehydrogenase subunit 2 [Gorpis annulatus]